MDKLGGVGHEPADALQIHLGDGHHLVVFAGSPLRPIAPQMTLAMPRADEFARSGVFKAPRGGLVCLQLRHKSWKQASLPHVGSATGTRSAAHSPARTSGDRPFWSSRSC